MIKFLIYKYYSHKENISTYQYLSSNTNQISTPNYSPPEAAHADNNSGYDVSALTFRDLY